MKFYPIGLMALAFLIWNCGGPTNNTETTSEEETGDEAEMAYTVTAFSPSQDYPDATLTSMEFADGMFNFGVAEYELGIQTPDAPSKMCANSAKGQHIHLIVDDQPYAAKYESSFSYEIPDGEHYILAFLSRSYHESIKNGSAHKAQKVMIANNSITSTEDITTPMLFYSRPKGTYIGDDTKKVMLDFYLVNADLGSEYRVKADINGEIHMIDTWQPYYVEGLPMGENTITLTLVDAEGNPIDAPHNPVTRNFTLQADVAPQQ